MHEKSDKTQKEKKPNKKHYIWWLDVLSFSFYGNKKLKKNKINKM
jgi:hypothetical protein